MNGSHGIQRIEFRDFRCYRLFHCFKAFVGQVDGLLRRKLNCFGPSVFRLGISAELMSPSRFLQTAVLFSLALFLAPSDTTNAQKKDSRSEQAAPSVANPFTEVRRESLLNGLQLVSFETSSDRVRCDLIIHCGSMFDLEGKAGLAALTQASLLSVNPQLKEEIESLKGEITWGIDWDATWYRLDVPANALETAIEILGRLVVVENVRNDALSRAQSAHVASLTAKRSQLSPIARADEEFLKAIYDAHPYARTVEGDPKTVATIQQGDIFDFERRFYMANNASFVVVGPVRHERVLRTLKFLFGGWVKAAAVPATFRQPQRNAAVRVVKIDADAPKLELRGGLVGIRGTDPDFLAVQVMARVLEARLKRDASYQSSDRVAVYAPMRVLPGPVFFSASIATDRAAAFSRAATDGFAAMAAQAVSAEELLAAKASLTGERAAMSIADQLREIEYYSLPRNYPLTYAPRLGVITAADVQRVAQRLLSANALTLVVFGPAGEGFKPQS
jgi:zinc protease